MTFTDNYDFNVNAYSATDVRVAFVNVAPGRPQPLTSADGGLCG